MEFKINNKTINIFYDNTELDEVPVIILNTFENEGKMVFEKCMELKTKDFILVCIAELSWNNDLTPWECPPIYKGDTKYLGYADKYLNEIRNDIVPVVEKYIINTLNKKIAYYGIAGYSLGGLFALYAGYKTNMFKRIASASGSLWYPNFLEYVMNNKLNGVVDKVYLSLGNKEANSKNMLLSSVYDNTIKIYNYIKKDVSSIYEENEGNHFNDAILRMAKGIKWIIE